jgi:polyphosphate kinase
VAPVNLRDRLVQLIRNEVKSAEAGRPARIIAKLNSLTDDDIIEELYSASEAGVAIDLIVRGVCTLRPGVEGMSSNIRVRSIVGRFLEHSRIYYFANGDSENSDQVYIASADWMQRNLDRRVEIAVPVLDPDIKRFIKDKLLDAHLRDTVNARTLRPDGTYEKVRAKGADFDAQMSFEGVDITA